MPDAPPPPGPDRAGATTVVRLTAALVPTFLALLIAAALPIARNARAQSTNNTPAPVAASAASPPPSTKDSNAVVTAVDRIAFDAAVRTLQAGFAAQAAEALASFVKGSPDSPLAPQALLLQAKATADLGQLETAAQMLSTGEPRLGALRDQALQLRGEIEMRRGDYPTAAASFHRLVAEMPESPLVLRASFHEALALLRARQPAEAVALLSVATNAFPRAAAGQPNGELAIRGELLLAEAQLRAGQTDRASEALDHLTNRPLTPAQAWERQLLVTSLLLEQARTEPALDAATRLLTLAEATASRESIARSHILRAEVLSRAGRPAEAFAALTNNLPESTPTEQRRDSLLALTELPLGPALIEPALTLLAPVAAQPPPDPAALVARLAVAELRLQQHFLSTPPPVAPSTNLAQARLLVSGVLSNNPASGLAGRAWYDLGWIELASIPPRTPSPPALEAFSRSASLLPSSPLQALALFKSADCLMLASNPAAAATQYVRVVREYGTRPSLDRGVLERALYQGALAALVAGQQSLANELAGRAVVEFPEGAFRDDTRVLYGQTLARLDPPGLAREVLQQLATRLTNSPALPEIQLNVARSYFRERSWSNALQHLDDWTRSNPGHASIARAEFEQAWAAFRTGNDARAHNLFTNFLGRHPDHPSAPQAQMWVGDHLFRNGQFTAAEAAYQLVYQRTNWPISRLTHDARLMAGRAAYSRQGYKDAKPYFLWLIANGPPAITNSLIPGELVARAYFALGDCFLQDPEGDDKLNNAMTAFYNVIDKFPGSREALLARGKLANAHVARAALDPSQAATAYAEATRLYREILNPAAPAEIGARSQAEIGLATVLEKQAAGAQPPDRERLMNEALARLLHVFHAGNLQPGESASPFWLNRAGIEAARLAEALSQREQAASLYESLARTFPTSATAFQQRAAQLRSPR